MDAERGAGGLQEAHGGHPDSAPALPLYDEELVEEGIAAVELDATTEGEGDVADGRIVEPDEPDAAERGVAGQVVGRAAGPASSKG